ncbi:unnamed protein product, partial [Candidula unifasciata]
VLLQVFIIMTGNYNFFNLLTITLCISLLDDSSSLFTQPRYRVGGKKQSKAWTVLQKIANIVFPVVVLGYISYMSVILFSLKFNNDYTVSSKIAFTKEQFTNWLEKIMPYTIYLGAASLGLEVVTSFIRSLIVEKGLTRKLMCVLGTVFFSLVAVFMFTISLVPHTIVHKPAQGILPRAVFTYHGLTRPFHVTSSYGLFRRMTGVGGRPELIIEGHAKDRQAADGWLTYEFLYKPGNVSEAPPIVAPHQPRLDWQMWFAALGNYQNNPWFLNLVCRLLQNQPEVLQLLAHNPFPDKPPKYIRATLYHYHYTSPKDCAGKTRCDWWKREEKHTYLPGFSLEDKAFADYLKASKILQDEPPKKFKPDSFIAKMVLWFRGQVGQPEGFGFTVSLFGSAILVIFLSRAIKSVV